VTLKRSFFNFVSNLKQVGAIIVNRKQKSFLIWAKNLWYFSLELYFREMTKMVKGEIVFKSFKKEKCLSMN
jgi:hypothetical protein